MERARQASPSSSYAWLGVLVALSGAAGLIYELVWIRALGLHFGTTTPAITTVVATFMAGLGLGSVWFGKLADRSAQPLRLYRRLELCIGIAGLAVSLLLLRGGAWLDPLARWCAASGSFSTLTMACVLAACMLVPTTAMGGTLPVLSRALSTRALPGRALGGLYAVNTLGAIAGALLPDFVLIPRYGMTATACVAASANLLVWSVAQRLLPGDAAPLTAAAEADADKRLSRSQAGALVLSACTGFCALGLEVLWGRTLQHWAAALVTSFSVLLAVYLAALSGGALLAQRFAHRGPRALNRAISLLGLTSLCVLAPIAASPAWRDLERAWWPRPAGLRRLGLLREAVDALLHASYLEAASCALMGACFPFVAAAWLAGGLPGVRTGQLLLVNTAAAVAGAVLVGFVCLPKLGEQTSYCMLAWVLAAVAALCALAATRDRWTRGVTLACLVSLAALTVWLPREQLFHAHFRTGAQLLAVKEGATTTAAAGERFVYGEPYYAELLTPGISMSSTRGDARRYMALMAHAALLGARTEERALLICYGVGNTAGALLSHRGLTRLDVIDISPEVLALAPYFARARGDDPLHDPRTHVFVDDGRHHLITHDDRYDVITAEPPPPNYAGVVNLYSREFYRLAKSHLRPGGIITQWLPVFQLADSDVRAMIAAFVAELPYTALLYGYEQQLILIGGLAPLSLDAGPRAQAVARNLRNNDIGSVEDLLGSVLQTDAELRAQVAGVAPLSDERPTIQYPYETLQEHAIYTAHFAPNPQRAAFLLASHADPALQARVQIAWQATERARAALRWLDREPPEARELGLGRQLQAALDARPDDEGLWMLLAADRDRVHRAEIALHRDGAQALLVQRFPSARYLVLQDALWVLARRTFYAHDYAHALGLLAQVTGGETRSATLALLKAGCLRALGDSAASAAEFRAAAAASGDPAFRAECGRLADRASEPFERTGGPWSLRE